MLGNSSTHRQDKRCDYNEDVGHLTNDCIVLRKHLEDLAEEGHLQKYLKDDRWKRGKGASQPQNNRGPERATSGNTIDTIHGVISQAQAS